jgi:hypothetical protein
MRYRLMATYRGVPYHVGLGPDGNEATLLSPAPPPDELGFTSAGGYWRKQVSVADLDALWQARVVGDYRGEPCLVLDDLGDRLHLAYLGRDPARARQLGYWEIDREVFEVVVGRADVTGLTEERVEYPLASAMFPPSNRDPGVPARPEAAGRGTQAPGGVVSPAGPFAAPAMPPAAMPPAAERTSPLRAVPRPGPQPAPAGRPPGGRREPVSQREPAGHRETEGHRETGGHREPGGHAEADRMPRTPDRMAAWHGSPETEPWSGGASPRIDPRSDVRRDPRLDPHSEAWPRSEPGAEPRPGGSPEPRPGPPAPTLPPAAPSGRRSGRRDRVPQSVFGELLSLAAIPHAAYAVDEEIPGAMCLVKADGGFEVFSRTDDARLDVRFFEDEEAAYFYLFGVLAAEAVRSGRLQPARGHVHANGSRGPRVSPAPAEKLSKPLQS